MFTSSHPHLRRIVLDQLQQARWHLAGALACIAGSTLATLAAPWPLKLVFDQVLGGHTGWPGMAGLGSTAALLLCCTALVVIAVVAGACSYGQQFITTRVGAEIVGRLRAALFDHVQRLSLDFHHRSRSGELMSRITADTGTLRDIYAEFALVALTHGLAVLGMAVVLVTLHAPLGLLATASFPVLFVLLHRRLRQVKARARQQRSNEGRLASQIGDMLGTVTLVQAFGREAHEKARFDEATRQSTEQSIDSLRAEAAGSRLVEVVTAAATAGVLLCGGLLAIGGRLSAGELLVFMAYVAAMFRPVKNLARLSARLAKARASIERIEELLAIAPEADDAPGAIHAGTLHGAIGLRAVSVEQGGRKVLDGVDLQLPAGARVAIVGPSGAGKSTLVKLLLRLLDPSSGEVSIDGVPLAHYQRSWLRSQIGVVLQDNLLLGISVRDNIAYGKVDAEAAEVEAAARAACAHDFILTLPGGYDHVLGQAGATLSGGQRQRLCLARALIKQPAILIMDEPTSAIDAESARQIRAALRDDPHPRTTLLIAHQLEMVADADWVVVLRDGCVVEQGPPADLARSGGAYAELFHLPRVARQAA
jgi:ABC-type multidrug transport system fused ATPase/permease subunit